MRRRDGRRSGGRFAIGSIAVGAGALWILAAGSAAADSHAAVPRTPAPEGARVYFISPSDGESVESPVTVRFGLAGAGVAPAGVKRDGTGHHHLLIDTELANPGVPVPSDPQHRHFGGGQTEFEVELEPGRHTLELVLGDHLHVPHDPPIASDRIVINVK